MLDHPNLVACWSFDGTAADLASGLTTSASNARYDAGIHGDAIHLDSQTLVTVAETPFLDVTQLTLMAWVKLDVLPAVGQRSVIFDNNEQYAFSIHDDGVGCTGGTTIAPGAGFVTGRWYHVACVRRATVLAVYADGVLVEEREAGGALGISGVEGSRIGGNIADGPNPSAEPLLGAIDDLQFFNIDLDDETICAAAGGC